MSQLVINDRVSDKCYFRFGKCWFLLYPLEALPSASSLCSIQSRAIATYCVLVGRKSSGEFQTFFFLELLLYSQYSSRLCFLVPLQIRPNWLLCKSRSKWFWVQGSPMAPPQTSYKPYHLEHVHTRANLLLQHIQIQEITGFNYRYVECIMTGDLDFLSEK